jgi:hypothetical protein
MEHLLKEDQARGRKPFHGFDGGWSVVIGDVGIER